LKIRKNENEAHHLISIQAIDTRGMAVTVACCCFACTEDGVYLFYVGVSEMIYSKSRFGKSADGKSFRRAGFGSFCRKLCSVSLHNRELLQHFRIRVVCPSMKNWNFKRQ